MNKHSITISSPKEVEHAVENHQDAHGIGSREENRYCWDVIDRALERAKQSQQQLHIRFMPHGAGIMMPKWYIKKGSIIEYICTRSGKKLCIPDYDDTKKFVPKLKGKPDDN